MYQISLDDSYCVRPICAAASTADALEILKGIMQKNHIPIHDLNIYQESEMRTVVDYGSWTHFFYIDKGGNECID